MANKGIRAKFVSIRDDTAPMSVMSGEGYYWGCKSVDSGGQGLKVYDDVSTPTTQIDLFQGSTTPTGFGGQYSHPIRVDNGILLDTTEINVHDFIVWYQPVDEIL